MIVVTGMHRSGTSMTLLLLSALDAPFGDPADMIAADQWNRSGYFENREAVGINLRLLLGLNVDVDNWIYPPANQVARLVNVFTSGKWRYLFPVSDATIEKRANALDDEITDFGARFEGVFVKDPRFAVTYAHWRKRLEIEGAVFCFRHPVSVQRSIARRDLMPTRMASRMWLQYNAGFVNALSGHEPVLLVDYDNFFTPHTPDYIARLGAFVAARTGATPDVEKALARIDTRQRHHSAESAAIANPAAAAAYEALRAVAAGQDGAVPAAQLREALKQAGFP
jgi:hypothetical protein